MSTGIYSILNLITGDFYVGSASRSIAMRWYQHRRDLTLGLHGNYRLQEDWQLYGAPNFRFSVLEYCPPGKCIECEQHFMDASQPTYNISRIAGAPMQGRHHTTATRAKMSAARMGRKPSPETRAKISTSKMGHVVSVKTRAKIGDFKRGIRLSKEHRAKMSIAQQKRYRQFHE